MEEIQPNWKGVLRDVIATGLDVIISWPSLIKCSIESESRVSSLSVVEARLKLLTGPTPRTSVHAAWRGPVPPACIGSRAQQGEVNFCLSSTTCNLHLPPLHCLLFWLLISLSSFASAHSLTSPSPLRSSSRPLTRPPRLCH